LNTRNIFLSDNNQSFFDKNGYIILPYAEPSEIDKLISDLKKTDAKGTRFLGYQENFHHKHDMHSTFWDTDMRYREEIYEELTSFFATAKNKFLTNYKFAQANVFIKYPKSGYIAPHQNLTIVNEDKYTSLSFWCPSIDTQKSNGGMLVVPGSHKKFITYRATNFSWPLFDQFNNYDNDLWLSLQVKKGELLIIDDSIIHITGLNKSMEERWAFHALLIPEEAEPFICEADYKRGKMLLKKIPDGFLQQFTPSMPTDELTIIQEIDLIQKTYSREETRNILFT
jgi:ectoine hydroxylase-related dioxygenase (phytanoyl-CoA dioxygenase family)